MNLRSLPASALVGLLSFHVPALARIPAPTPHRRDHRFPRAGPHDSPDGPLARRPFHRLERQRHCGFGSSKSRPLLIRTIPAMSLPARLTKKAPRKRICLVARLEDIWPSSPTARPTIKSAIFLAPPEGDSAPRLLAPLTGFAKELQWSPDGELLGFLYVKERYPAFRCTCRHEAALRRHRSRRPGGPARCGG